MDSMKQQKVHALSKFKRCHRPVLKGAFQILLSVSLFSLFFLSYPSSTNPRSLKPFLSASISSHLNFEANRNLMFLLCNAILVFVTGGFGYFRVSSLAAEDMHGEYLERSAAHHRSVPVEDKEVTLESVVLVKNGVTDIEVEDELEEEAAVAGADQEHHQPQLPVQEEEEENENENYRLQQQKQDERGGLVVIEESDERFDDFIKQVKEGMRMEAKQLLLTA